MLVVIGVLMFFVVLFGLKEMFLFECCKEGGLIEVLCIFGVLLKDGVFVGYVLV